MDHQAIYKAYTGVVVTIDDAKGAFDKDGKKVKLVQSKIDAARAELAKLDYQLARVKAYDTLANQLDMLYHDLVAGKLDATGTWAKHIKAVKDANPKP